MEPEEILGGITVNDMQIADDHDGKDTHFRHRWRDEDYKRTIYHSMAICGSIFALGCIKGQTGAIFLDLQIITDTDLEQASAFLTSGAVGQLTGTFICGIIFGKVNADLLLFTSGLLVGVATFTTPFCANYHLMIFIRFVNFFIAAFVDTGCNALLISLWGTGGKQWMQCLHFSFAFGGVLSPLYTEPFLAPSNDDNNDEIAANYTTLNMTSSFAFNSSFPNRPISQDTNVKYAFMISSVFVILSSIPLLPFYLMTRRKVREQRKNGNNNSSMRNQRKLPRNTMLLTLMLACFFLMSISSVEVTSSDFLMTFLVREYDSVSKSKAALVISLFWASFASGRFLNVFISRAFPLSRLLGTSIALTIAIFTGFLVSAQHAIIDALVVFVVLAGLSMSGLSAATFSWTEAELLKVNGLVTGVLKFFSALAGIISPVVLGHLMEHVNNMWFCYVLLVMSVVTGLLFVFLLAFSRCFLIPKFGPCGHQAAVPMKTFENDDPQRKHGQLL